MVRKTEEQPAKDSGRIPRGTPSKIPQPFDVKSVGSTAGNAGRSKPAASDLARGGNMPQYKASEHDAHMQNAAKHSTYTKHDGKANAPLPFNAFVGSDLEDVDAPTHGQETMPKPFNTGKSKTAGRGQNEPAQRSKDWKP